MSHVVLPGRFRLGLLAAALLALPGAASALSGQQPSAPSVTHGVVVGDVTARSAVLGREPIVRRR